MRGFATAEYCLWLLLVKKSISFELYLNVSVVDAAVDINFISFCRIKDEEVFSSVAATEVSTPGVLAGGNEGAERSEATPENETNAEMGPPPLTSNNQPSISTRESNIPDSARCQLREGDIQPDPGLRKPIESLGRTLEMLLEGCI